MRRESWVICKEGHRFQAVVSEETPRTLRAECPGCGHLARVKYDEGPRHCDWIIDGVGKCGKLLSRYNREPYCYVHRTVAADRRRGVRV